MKLEEKEFCISQGERPKVLLLGNGICRAFGKNLDWNELLENIKDKERYRTHAANYLLPMSIKAILLTNNHIAEKMKNLTHSRKEDVNNEQIFHWEDFTECSDSMRKFLLRLLSLNFDYILTTNYTYELESALLGTSDITEYQISKLVNTIEVSHPQTRYHVNTFNMIKKDDKEYHIWHIHGEARKPDSMILGHNYYGRLLDRMVQRITESDKIKQFKNNIRREEKIKIGSWLDAFILGDVYILGLGLDFSELDLWWLLDQKNILNEISGKTTIFSRKKEVNNNCPLKAAIPKEIACNRNSCEKMSEYVFESECRQLLMDVYGIKRIEIPQKDEAFYEESLKQLEKVVGMNNKELDSRLNN